MVMLALGRLLGFGARPVHAWPENKGIKILEPCPRGPQTVFLQEKFEFFAPEFDAEKIRRGADPRKYADIQDLPFEEGSFDVVIASDVFEHVRDDRRGFQEIYRTLRPDGAFILTVPYDHDRPETKVNVEVRDGREIFHEPPRYHGGGGETLEYRRYGRDLLAFLSSMGFAVGYLASAVPRFQIPHMSLILGRKAAFFDLGDFWTEARETDGEIASLGPLLPFRLFNWYKFNLKGFGYFLRQLKNKLS